MCEPDHRVGVVAVDDRGGDDGGVVGPDAAQGDGAGGEPDVFDVGAGRGAGRRQDDDRVTVGRGIKRGLDGRVVPRAVPVDDDRVAGNGGPYALDLRSVDADGRRRLDLEGRRESGEQQNDRCGQMLRR